MWSDNRDLRRATAADIPIIMEIERQPEFDKYVGRWNETEHQNNIANPGYLYLVLDGSEGLPIAFAALSGMGDAKGEITLNRMIVRNPGHGLGKILLPRIMQLVFDGLPASRMLLRVATYNDRAIRVYRSLGFTDEKLLPKAGRRPDGMQVDLMLMSIDWEKWRVRHEAATS
jgi:RimJ/RimL family protein N-acetyltransferase